MNGGSKRSREWFDSWFDETYLALYSHRDTHEARQFVNWIADHYADEASAGVIDLACGAGRHSHVMADEQCWNVIGIDLSHDMLFSRDAREYTCEGHPPLFVQGDLRSLPFQSNSFGLAVNLFTSFGYFRSDEEHISALRQIYEVLTTGGIAIFDLINPDHALRTLVPHDLRQIGTLEVDQLRTFDQRTKRLEKRIIIRYPNGVERNVLESVRLFSNLEMSSLLSEAGFTIVDQIGSYQGESYDPEASERMILIGRKAG